MAIHPFSWSWLWPRCPECGKKRLRFVDYVHVYARPPKPWPGNYTVYECTNCSQRYARSPRGWRRFPQDDGPADPIRPKASE